MIGIFLIEKYFIVQECKPSSQPSVSSNLFAGGGLPSMLMAAD